MEKLDIVIKEESYQQFKKENNKINDYCNIEELIKLRQNYDKYKK